MNDNPASLSLIASVNHAADSLGLYRAELARILDLMCQDVSDSIQLESTLESSLECRLKAEQFVVFYDALEERFSADTVAMVNWFRQHNVELDTTPFLAMVDENRPKEVLNAVTE